MVFAQYIYFFIVSHVSRTNNGLQYRIFWAALAF